MSSAENTNVVYVLARWVNPACIEEDFACDGQIELVRKGLEHYFGNNKKTKKKNLDAAQYLHGPR